MHVKTGRATSWPQPFEIASAVSRPRVDPAVAATDITHSHEGINSECLSSPLCTPSRVTVADMPWCNYMLPSNVCA